MARSRMIKPEFWTDEKSGMLSAAEKCLFLGMLNFSDDEGLIKANPLYLKASIFPYDQDITPEFIKNALGKLQDLELIFLYTKNNQHFAWIIKFRIHQRVDKPQKPQNPSPRIDDRFRLAIFKRDGFVCHVCGRYTDLDACDVSPPRVTHDHNYPSVDHVIPKSKGGTDYPSNLKCACISCNKGKKDKTDDLVDTIEQTVSITRTFQEHSKNTLDETETETEEKEKLRETETEEHARGKKAKPPVKKFQPPTQDEVVAYFESNGYSADAAVRAYRYYDAGNWKDAKGSQVRNWKQKMVGNWFKDENKDRPQSGSVFQNLTGRDRQNAAVLDEFLRRKEREAASGL